jgi:hypothetical protein
MPMSAFASCGHTVLTPSAAMGQVQTWKPVAGGGAFLHRAASLPSEFEQLMIARMIADGAEIGIFLEP